jgi:hypothetical protein
MMCRLPIGEPTGQRLNRPQIKYSPVRRIERRSHWLSVQFRRA